jgi:CRISPR-associated protein Cmr1
MTDSRLVVLEVDLRVVTPLFLGGAEPNVRAELRPPTIKGVLRDWLRLVLGAERAAREESALAGGAGGGAGQSPYLLAIDRELIGVEEWDPPRPGRDRISGLRYLGYSLNFGANHRKALATGTSFRLEAAFPRGGTETQRRALLAGLWLLAHLGGLGSRSRRGLGSLSLDRWSDHPDSRRLPLLASAGDHGSAVRQLGEGLTVIGEWFPVPDPFQPASTGLGFRLADARVVVPRGPNRHGAWNDALEALEYVGATLQRFRMQRDLDGFPTVSMLAKGERLRRPPERTAFGLPLTYRQKGQEYTFAPHLPVLGGREGDGRDYARFPSPLLLHVQAIESGFLPTVTRLGGAQPGRDVPVRERRGRGYLAPDPSNDVLERFLERLIEGGALEVPR